MIQKSRRHFSSLAPACGFGCVTGALCALTCDAGLHPVLFLTLLSAGAFAWWRRLSSVLLAVFVSVVVLWVVRSDLARRWANERDAERVVAQCTVESLPEISTFGSSFDAACRLVLPRALALRRPRSLRVRLHLPPQPPALQPRAGESWQWLLELRAPRASANPGAIDVQRQWYRERIAALARLRPSTYTRRLTTAPPGLLHLRARIAQSIAERVDDRDARALLAALAVGATGELTRDQWRVFAATGITHLIAISGMHVTAFAMVAIALARRLWRHAPANLRRRLDRERFAAVFGLSCAIGYALLAGLSVPTQRTLLMLLIAAAARLSSRRIAPLTLLSLAAVAVLLIDPYAPLAAGFWLSFVAVAVLMSQSVAPRSAASASPAHWRARLIALARGAVGGMRLQTLIVFAMAPLTLALFGSVPLAGLLVNLLAIPLFSVALVPLTLAGMAALPLTSLGVELAAPLWRGAEWLWVSVAPWLQRAADFPAALWQPDVSVPWLAASPLCALAVVLRSPAALRLAALAALLLPLQWPAQAVPAPGSAQVTVLDAGLGTAVIVRSAHHALLFDTGSAHGSDGAAVNRLLLPALRALGVRRLDRLVLSTLSAAQVTGAAILINAIAVQDVRSAERWRSASVPANLCATRARWIWDGIEFSWLDAGVPAQCVLRVSAGAHTLLLTGNIDARAEQQLLTRDGAALASDVVLVPRHGSPQASSAQFVAAVRPRWAIAVNDGRGVRSSADRWRAVGAQWLTTHECGAVGITLSAQRVMPPQALRGASWHWPWQPDPAAPEHACAEPLSR